MRRTRSRALAAVGAAAAMVAVGALPSQARTDVTRTEDGGGKFYDNVATGTGQPDLILFADASPEDLCNGTPIPVELRVRVFGEPPNAGAREHVSYVKRVPLELYEGMGMSAPEFVGAYCAALEGAGAVPEPIGVGSGNLRVEVSIGWRGDQPPNAVDTSSVTGTVRTPDGQRLVVRGEAKNALTGPGVGVPLDVSVEIINR